MTHMLGSVFSGLLYSAVPFLLILGLLVFVHEFGHYVAAKRAGMKVYAFAIGMGPAIPGLTVRETALRAAWDRLRGRLGRVIPAGETPAETAGRDRSDEVDTTYSICMIPIGGYVRIAGMDPNEDPDEPGGFNTKPWLWRFVTLIAGCTMNFVLAAILLCSLGVLVGVVKGTTSQIDAVSPGMPAQKAGIRPGDRIVGVGGVATTDVGRLRDLIEARAARVTRIALVRNGQPLMRTLAPAVDHDEMGRRVGRIGVAFHPVKERVNPFEALGIGIQNTWNMTGGMIRGLVLMVRGKVQGQFGGPVVIFRETGKEAQQGAEALVSFAAMLSINLGIINLLPIPALDGGRLMFLLLEAVRGGRRVDPRKEAYVHFVGLVMLLLLMIVITYHDLFDKVR